MTKQRRLEIQSDAIAGFSAMLISSPRQSEEDREFDEQFHYILQTYRTELERQIAGSPVTEDWRNMVAVAAMLALMLSEVLIESDPDLSQYRPTDEPMTINEMVLRLLSDAVDNFQKCGRPEALAPISDLIRSVGS